MIPALRGAEGPAISLAYCNIKDFYWTPILTGFSLGLEKVLFSTMPGKPHILRGGVRLRVDVLVIGGGPAGIITAVTARRVYGRDLKVGLVRPEDKTLVPCGIPYIFGTLDETAKNRMPDGPLEAAGVELVTDEVAALDLEHKIVRTESGKTIEFDKLVLATGSEPFVPPQLSGTDLENVFTIKKSYSYLDSIRNRIADCRDIVIIGGGFIGVEIADELAKSGNKSVTVIEMIDNCLWQSFDPEFCEMAEKTLEERNVRVMTGTRVNAITGSGKVEKVELEGDSLKADAVILAIGARPQADLARGAGLELTRRGAIAVDAAMRTSNPDVFAVGDCAAKTDFFSGTESPLMLASIATIEARIAGANLYEVKALSPGGGTRPGAFSTMVGKLALASAGLTETEARRRNLDVIVGVGESVDKHPGSLPGARPVKVKLVFSRLSGKVLGGQVAGGVSAGEMGNVIALAVGSGLTAADLYLMPLGTHPLLTPAPTTYPIVGAAWDYLRQTTG